MESGKVFLTFVVVALAVTLAFAAGAATQCFITERGLCPAFGCGPARLDTLLEIRDGKVLMGRWLTYEEFRRRYGFEPGNWPSAPNFGIGHKD